jgi:hypothetical protein
MFKLVSVRNNPSRLKDVITGIWGDVTTKTVVNNEIVSTKEYNPDAIDICFESHLNADQLGDTELFKRGVITGSALATISASIAKGNPLYVDKLMVNDDDKAEYKIVAKSVKGSTRKSMFRHATITNGGSSYPVTYVSVTIGKSQPVVACEVAI